jgi:hypothetical protein
MNQAFAECHQEQGLAVCGAFSVRIVHVVDEIFHILSAVLPIADLAVVHESPVLPSKRVAVAAVHRRTSGGTDMGKKQLGLNVRCKGAKIGIIPCRQHVFAQSSFSQSVGPPQNSGRFNTLEQKLEVLNCISI